jgi:WD40 repeat protein/serine/threonine protein kinase
MIPFQCPGCGKNLQVPDDAAGKPVKCPGCGRLLRVPEALATPSLQRTVPPTSPPRANGQIEDQATVPPAEGQASGDNAFQDQTCNEGSQDQGAELVDFLAPPLAPDEIGRLGPYRVLKVLGAGGMGVVFLGEDPQLQRPVALKAMLPSLAASGSAKQRFLREARAAAAIKHDHIVAIYQVGQDRGAPYLAMELLEGEPLDERLKRTPPLSLAELLRIGRETATGLAAAHQRGLIHRDIKPANLWLEKQDHGLGAAGFQVKILDFGLARADGAPSQLTQQGAIVGTPAFMAPEQATGETVDGRCDLFSLGCVLYRLLTGRLPFQGPDTVATLMAVATEHPKPPAEVKPETPAELSDLVMRLLAKKPGDRPASAQEVVAALAAIESAQADATTTDAKPFKRPVLKKPAGTARRPLLWAAALVLLAAGLAGGIYVLTRQPEQGPQGAGPDPNQPAKDNPFDRLRREDITPAQRELATLEDGTFPDSIVAILGDARFNHNSKLDVASFDTEGKVLATWGQDLRAQLWEYPSGKLLRRWQALALAGSGDGKRLAYYSFDGKVHLWDRAAARLLDTPPITLAANPDQRPRLALDRTGATVAVDLEGTKVFRPGGPARALLEVPEALVDIAPDGLTVLTWKDKIYSLREVLTGKVIRTLEVPERSFGRFAPDGKTVALAVYGAVIVWDPAEGKLRDRLKVGGHHAYPMAFSADSKRLALGNQGIVIRIFDVNTLQEIKEQNVTPTFQTGVADEPVPRTFTPDGKKLLYTLGFPPRNGILWSHDFDARQTTSRQAWVGAGLAANGSLLALRGASFDLSTWKPDGSAAPPEKLANDPTGRLFVSADGHYVFSGDSILRGWDAALHPELTGQFWKNNRNTRHVVSKDGRLIALVKRTTIEIWDWVGQQLVQTITEPDETFGLAELSPDATVLATVGKVNKVRLWSIATGRPAGELEHSSPAGIDRLRFTPDGKHVLTAHGNDNRVHVLDVGSGKERIAHAARGVSHTAIDVSPNGKMLVQAMEGGVRFIDLLTGVPTRADLRLGGPRGWIRELYYAPDGRHLITVNGDGTVYVLRLEAGKPDQGPPAKEAEKAPPPAGANNGVGPPLSPLALVSRPPTIPGVDSWSIEPRGHRGPVSQVAYSKDSTRLASGGDDGTVRLWDPRSGQLQRILLGHARKITRLAWSPDGKVLASGSDDSTVRLWEADTGKLLFPLAKHTGPIRALAWSPDGKTLASGSADRSVHLWDPATGASRRTFDVHKDPVVDVAWLSESTLLSTSISRGLVNTLWLWEAGSGKTLHSHEAQGHLAWTADRKLLVHKTGKDTLAFWDVAANTKRSLTLKGHQVPIRAFDISPDGTMLATGGLNQVQWWDAATGKLLTVSDKQGRTVTAVVFSPDGRMLASLGQDGSEVWLWKTDPAQKTGSANPFKSVLMHFLRWAAWSPDARMVLSGSDETVKFWDAASGKALHTLPMHWAGDDVAWAPGGQRLAIGNIWHKIGLWIWEADTGAFVPSWEDTGWGGLFLDWSGDGKLATSSGRGAHGGYHVHIWDLQLRKRSQQLSGHTNNASAAIFSPDSKKVATCGTFQSDRVIIFDVASGKGMELPPPGAHAPALAWSPDSQLLAAGGPAVRVWDASTGKPLPRKLTGLKGRIPAVAWSPDGQVLAAGDTQGTIALWSSTTGASLKQVKAHDGPVHVLAWLADSKTLASLGEKDGTACFWQTDTDRPPRITRGLPGKGRFSPDRRFLISRFDPTRVQLWNVETGRLQGTYLHLDGEPVQHLAVSAEGQYRISAQDWRHVVYVVQTQAGQEMLTPEEMEKKYLWKNDPEKVRLLSK